MAITQFRASQLGANSVGRDEVNTTVSGQALITRIIQGTGITISSTGVDTGTGDVTINASGAGIVRSINSITTTTSGAATALTDYVYLASGTFTFTLPTAVGNTNKYTIKNTGTGAITITTTSSQTIDGESPTLMDPLATKDSLDFISDGTNWIII